jgi:hypothetical protein
MASSVGSVRLLNQLTSLIHPDLHEAGLSALQTLREQSDTARLAKQWTSIWTGIAVIANRRTIEHRDRRSRPNWYDLLVSLGSHGAAKFRMPELGLVLQYKPGDVVALCGSVFLHEVGDWGDGDRFCYAFFMREKVLERLNQGSEQWGNRNMYRGTE